jgi:hypothetical protein
MTRSNKLAEAEMIEQRVKNDKMDKEKERLEITYGTQKEQLTRNQVHF